MTMKLSIGLRNAMAGPLGAQRALTRGIIKIFSGSQPVSPDAAEGGTLLGIMSVGHGSVTRETPATATLLITASSGTLAYVKVGTLPIIDQPGEIVFDTDTATTAAAIAKAINRCGVARASVSGSTITVSPPPGFGATWNGLALASSGIAGTGSNFAGGVDAVNGLVLEVDDTAPYRIQKPAAADWSFIGLANGVAGWFRYYAADGADTGATDGGAPYYPRLDGTCGVGSGDAQLSTLSVVIGGPVSVDRFRLTLPAN